jgi:hypothetical protein
MPFTPADIDHLFEYHRPSAEQQARYQAIRTAARLFALVLVEQTRPSADQTAAMRKLSECVMTANKSIALEPEPALPGEPEPDRRREGELQRFSVARVS